MLPTFLNEILVHFLSFFPTIEHPASPPPLHFELRHLHATSSSARVVFQDVPPLATSMDMQLNRSFTVGTRHIRSYKAPSYESQWAARFRSMKFSQSQPLNWEPEIVPGPDVESRDTLLQLAKMSNNAYVNIGDPSWYELGDQWNNTYPFGWEPDEDGFRGQVYATPDNATVIVSIKGTSAGVLGGGGPTTKKDKLNDNLLFSCCCARVDWTWTTVCDCHRGGWKCDQECVENALIEESLFYYVGINLYNNLTYIYPDSKIWVIGHSLGGSLASLVGVTFGAPVVAFEAPGEKMAASRLHLPSAPSTQHITHVYHTADPIAMGTCNGVLSSCAIAGYAMESRCHLGKSIIYDTVSNSSWSVDVRTHGIVAVIEKILSNPWPPSVEIGREVPEAASEDDCIECYSWDFGTYPMQE
ncbi:alpha/beta-hydrolase [Lentinula raphanica]|uniref:triacylglycerol lipase n=1 Tax=Lentinula raphanica TaxID=153919 RepID=A0AA38UKK6_9AGAR|nr:alpha/beta-hydrolase [Lentinula raphanica]KAJ3830099.1 alpha/beta-hydrolase [Lentinula raphanica]KAJ3844815.1 alpha/beta-hydrolase [Lentinula raphanica]KAJ3968931.1 alpha/beta-hydrolase [Lentinula raphanica]